MVACLICSGEDFYNAHGLYFCKICDTQTFDFHELADLDLFGDTGVGEAATSANVVTGAKIVTGRSQANKTLTQTFIEDDTLMEDIAAIPKTSSNQSRPFTTFELFQTILSAQTNQLLKLGFPTILRKRVFKIWCVYLSRIGEAFSGRSNCMLDLARVRDRDAVRLTKSNPGFISKRKRDKDDEKLIPLTIGAGEYSSSPMISNKLNMNTILCILYLAINVTDPLYTLTDIIRWIKDGTLSYFNADSLLPADMKLLYKDHHIFSHLVLPTHSKLRAETAALARYLQFTDHDFPPINIELLCVRYIVALNLPGEMIKLTLNLIHCKKVYLRFSPNNIDLRKTSVPQYEAVALSYVIITLRHLFGFYQRLDHHLSAYAAAVQSQIADNQIQLFNVDKWMQFMVSAVRLDGLPRNNLDTQRLASLKSTLDRYSSIVPPVSRFSQNGVSSVAINRQEIRKQLSGCLDQISLNITNYKQQQQRLADRTDDVATSMDADEDSASSGSPSSSIFGEPEVTSTQVQHQPPPPTPPTTSSNDFRAHKLTYVLDHKQFCKDHRLIKRHKYDLVQEHVQQYIGDVAVAAQVTDSLLSGGNYRRLDKDQLSQAPSLLALFGICAEFACISVKELHDVYIVIEEAYICMQNHIPVDKLSSQFIYFPRQSTE